MKYEVRYNPLRPFHVRHVNLIFTVQVRALPTVIAFKDGEPVAKFVGAIPGPKVIEFLKSV
jgi:thioredoxin-like negative regulator of GroEL